MLVAAVPERDGHRPGSLTTKGTPVLYEDEQLRIIQASPPDTVLLNGDVDITNSSAVADVFTRVSDRCGRVMVDTTGLRFIDISGWRVLIAPDADPPRRPLLLNVAPCVERLTRRMLRL